MKRAAGAWGTKLKFVLFDETALPSAVPGKTSGRYFFAEHDIAFEERITRNTIVP
ncbi:MAG: hypothetical protein ACI4XE_11015 [Acutalibacteraceae bacterium]